MCSIAANGETSSNEHIMCFRKYFYLYNNGYQCFRDSNMEIRRTLICRQTHPKLILNIVTELSIAIVKYLDKISRVNVVLCYF